MDDNELQKRLLEIEEKFSDEIKNLKLDVKGEISSLKKTIDIEEIDRKIKKYEKINEKNNIYFNEEVGKLKKIQKTNKETNQKLKESINKEFENKIEEINKEKLDEKIRKIVATENLKDIEQFSILNDFVEKKAVDDNETSFEKFNLIEEISNIRKNASLAFIVSLIAGGIALIYLISVFFGEIAFGNEKTELNIDYFSIRLTIFILLMSFFIIFKRKEANLYEIRRYYINELQNIVIRDKALKIALKLYPDKSVDINNILNNLIKTERNILLNKDQSTVELEKHKYKNETMNNSLNNFLSSIPSLVAKK